MGKLDALLRHHVNVPSLLRRMTLRLRDVIISELSAHVSIKRTTDCNLQRRHWWQNAIPLPSLGMGWGTAAAAVLGVFTIPMVLIVLT